MIALLITSQNMAGICQFTGSTSDPLGICHSSSSSVFYFRQKPIENIHKHLKKKRKER